MQSALPSVLILFMLLLLQAMVIAVHFALTTASRKLLKERNESERVQQVLEVMERDEELNTQQQYLSLLLAMIGTAILVQEFASPIATQLTTWQLESRLADVLALVILILPSSILILMVGYQLPVATVGGRSEGLAFISYQWARFGLSLLSPLLRFTTSVSNRIGILLGGEGNIIHVTEEEIKTLVKDGAEEGSIEADEQLMIYSVLRFGDTMVRELMVPRIDMVAIEIETDLDEALDTIIRAGHSRIPVYENSIDNIKGILYAKDLLVYWREKRTSYHLSNLIRKPYFVPESKRADELLDEFRVRESHIALVNDEYGGTAGLVTLEDLLEQIVGDIRDEYDFFEEAAYEVIGENEYLCMAWIDLDDLNEMLDISLPTDDNDTLGGYIFSQLGELPEVGDMISAFGYEFEVKTLKGERRINQVHVRKIEETEDNLPESLEEASLEEHNNDDK